jgi:hypothetical protein
MHRILRSIVLSAYRLPENQGQTLATSGYDVMLVMNETVMALIVDGFLRATA